MTNISSDILTRGTEFTREQVIPLIDEVAIAIQPMTDKLMAHPLGSFISAVVIIYAAYHIGKSALVITKKGMWIGILMLLLWIIFRT